MKIIVDDKIPFIKGEVEQLADQVIYLSGKSITREDVRDADVLIIRTRTLCNAALLEGSSVRFIVTATIGYDHIDTWYCETHGIRWTNCPGCNANSVCQYVHHALEATGCLQPDLTVGIVGVGHVGTCIFEDLDRMGMKVLLCDPPRHDTLDFIAGHPFVDLSVIQEHADVITFHTPLAREGKYQTYHMADEAFFKGLKRKPLIINASRGEVVDNRALMKALNDGIVRDAVVDTWENEPDINRDLLQRAAITTPHVAGYSANGKANATRMSLEAVAHFLNMDFTPNIILPEAPCLSVESLLDDSDKLKKNPDGFESFRGDYPVRREVTYY